jgi:putative flippase GtrA
VRFAPSGAAPQWLRFLLVGAVGFVVDGAILLLLVHGGGFARTWSRIPSFVVAVTATWWLHRRYTFGHAGRVPPSVREWMRFAFANALGNGLNLALYWMLIVWRDWSIVAALAVASAIAAAINYKVSAAWVFARPATSAQPRMPEAAKQRP